MVIRLTLPSYWDFGSDQGRNYFPLTDIRKVKAIRMFPSKAGWIAIYAEDELNHDAR